MLKLASTAIFTMPAGYRCRGARYSGRPLRLGAALLHELVDARPRRACARSTCDRSSTSTCASSSLLRKRNSSSAAGTGVSRVTTNWQKSPEWCDCGVLLDAAVGREVAVLVQRVHHRLLHHAGQLLVRRALLVAAAVPRLGPADRWHAGAVAVDRQVQVRVDGVRQPDARVEVGRDELQRQRRARALPFAVCASGTPRNPSRRGCRGSARRCADSSRPR